MVPPDPIPNSEVKRGIADGSVGFPHVRVGQCQTLKRKALWSYVIEGLFLCVEENTKTRIKSRLTLSFLVALQNISTFLQSPASD